MLKIRTVSNYLPTGVERRLMSSDFKIRKLGEQAPVSGCALHDLTIYLFIYCAIQCHEPINKAYLVVQITSSFLSPLLFQECPHTKASTRPLLLSPLLSDRPQLGTLFRPFTSVTPSTWGFVT